MIMDNQNNGDTNNMSDFESDLSQFDDEYSAAPDELSEGFESLPDGKYQAYINKAELKKTKTTGASMLSLSLKVISAPYAGRILFKNYVLDNADRVKWLKMDLLRLGVRLNKFSDLAKPQVLEQMLDVKIDVQQRTKGDYTNVYINKGYGKIAPSDYEQSNICGSGLADDDIPF